VTLDEDSDGEGDDNDEENEVHLELGRQWKVTVFHTFCIKRRVHNFNTKKLYENDT
jgi:hypothetical protein